MPRSKPLVAKRRFTEAYTNHKNSLVLVKRTRERLNTAIVAAVEAGCTRKELAEHMGVSITYISQTPGLEPAYRIKREKK